MKPKRTIGAPPALDRRAPWFSHTDISWRSYTKILTSRSKEDTIKSERIAVAFVTWAKAEYQTEPFKCYADYESCIEGKSGALFCAGLLAICLVRSIIPGTGAAPARF